MTDTQIKLMTPNAVKGALDFLKVKNAQGTNKSRERSIEYIEKTLGILDGKPGISKEDYDIATDRLNRMIIFREIKKNIDQNKKINNQIMESYLEKELKGKTSSIQEWPTLRDIHSKEALYNQINSSRENSSIALCGLAFIGGEAVGILSCAALFGMNQMSKNYLNDKHNTELEKDTNSLRKELEESFDNIPKIEKQLGKPKTLILGAQN